MTISKLFTLLIALACSGDSTPATPDEPCTGTTGSVEGEVLIDYNWGDNEPQPAPNAAVQANSDDGESLTIATDEQGGFSVQLTPGTWTFSARNAEGDCFSEVDISIDVQACEASTATLRISECYG